MSDKQPCDCAGSGGQGTRSGGATAAELGDTAKVAAARVPQAYEANFNLRLVPGRTLATVDHLGPRCRPRGNSTGWSPGVVAVDPALVATLAKADKAVVAWLAKDPANVQAFLAAPVTAIRAAGVELTRAEEKALARASAAAESARVVGPGVKVASLDAKVLPRGQVGRIGPTPKDDKPDDGPGCEPRRKG